MSEYNPSNNYPPTPTEHMTVKDWIITMIIMSIPLVNLVMVFVWAFSKTTNPSKSNYFKATLIFIAVILVFYFVIGASLIAAFR